jgi:DNA/RNA-binding domain of Phe-tRNA-synthetase-like protein
MTIFEPVRITVSEHPLLRIASFVTRFPAPLGQIPTPERVVDLLRLDAPTPLQREESVRVAVRDVLRYGGHRPSGIGKPASEYLIRAAEQGALAPINLAVDVCNAVSLHSGFPIGVADTGVARPPYHIAIAPRGSSYVFNPSGQEMALGGLLCLYDAEGPCINPVRDSQRTKTRPETVETLSVVWAPVSLQARLAEAERWYRGLLEAAGAETVSVEVEVVAGSAPVDNADSPPAESS